MVHEYLNFKNIFHATLFLQNLMTQVPNLMVQVPNSKTQVPNSKTQVHTYLMKVLEHICGHFGCSLFINHCRPSNISRVIDSLVILFKIIFLFLFFFFIYFFFLYSCLKYKYLNICETVVLFLLSADSVIHPQFICNSVNAPFRVLAALLL